MAILCHGTTRLVCQLVISAALYLYAVCLSHGFGIQCYGGEAIVGGTATLVCRYERSNSSPPFLALWKKRYVSDVLKYSVRRKTDKIEDPWRGRLTHLFEDNGTSGSSVIAIHNVTGNDTGEYVFHVHLRGVSTSEAAINLTVFEDKAASADNATNPVRNNISGCSVYPHPESTHHSCHVWCAVAIVAVCIITVLVAILVYKFIPTCRYRRCPCRERDGPFDNDPPSRPGSSSVSNGNVSSGVSGGAQRQRSNVRNAGRDEEKSSAASEQLIIPESTPCTRLQRISNVAARFQNKVNDLQVHLLSATVQSNEESSQSAENKHMMLTDFRNELHIVNDGIKKRTLEAKKYRKTYRTKFHNRIIDDIIKNLTNLEHQTVNLENEAIQLTMSIPTELNKAGRQRKNTMLNDGTKRANVGGESKPEEGMSCKLIDNSGEQKPAFTKTATHKREVHRNENKPKWKIPEQPSGRNNVKAISEDTTAKFGKKTQCLGNEQVLFKLAMHARQKRRLPKEVYKDGGTFRVDLFPKACIVCASAA